MCVAASFSVIDLSCAPSSLTSLHAPIPHHSHSHSHSYSQAKEGKGAREEQGMAARNAGGAAANRTGMDGRPALDADNSVEFVVKVRGMGEGGGEKRA